MKKKTLAIIPARGGSKRIPHKNIINFCGKPLILHTLETAKESGIFDCIHVSTDDKKTMEICENANFKIDFPRKLELADDITPLRPVMSWVIEEYDKRGQHFDNVVLLMATAPLLTANDLKSAYEMFEKNREEFPVLAVSEFPSPVEWAFRRDEKGFLTAVDGEKLNLRSQDLPKGYFDTGTFCIFKRENIVGSQRVDKEKYLSYILPRERAVDIDTMEDLRFAEMLYKIQKKL